MVFLWWGCFANILCYSHPSPNFPLQNDCKNQKSALERLWSVPSFKDIAMRTDFLDSNYIHKDGLLRVRRD